MFRICVPSAFLLALWIKCALGEGVDGSWSDWSDWSSCSVSCGRGVKKSFRACEGLRAGGRFCPGKFQKTEECDTQILCPVDGDWSEWSEWSQCSSSCGEGSKSRYRSCSNPIPLNGGKTCEGQPIETQSCFAQKLCPRDGKWSPWSDWSLCSVTCDKGGSMQRYRSCNNPPPQGEGLPCEGSAQESKNCIAPIKCPVNGQWSQWTEWSVCSVTCGNGERMRRRKCDDPPPLYGGVECNRTVAGDVQLVSCTAQVTHCPVDGHWSEWSGWGECHSPECGTPSVPNRSFRHRSCNSPLPAHKGRMCQGVFLDAGLCEQPVNCKVDGGWSDWSEWNCTRFVASRRRQCDNPPPSNGGGKCKGREVHFHVRAEEEELYREACPQFPTDDEDLSESSGMGAAGFTSDVDE